MQHLIKCEYVSIYSYQKYRTIFTLCDCTVQFCLFWQLRLLYTELNLYINWFPSVLTLLGSTAVSLGAGISRSLGILRQVILSWPVKDITPVLRETTDPLILKTTHIVWDVRVWRKNKRGKHIRSVACQPGDIINYRGHNLLFFFHPLKWMAFYIITVE